VSENHDANSNNNNSKLARKAGMFSSSKDVSRNLSDILLYYGTHGFEMDTDNHDGVILEPMNGVLEDSWTDVIHEDEDMTRKHKIQQEALWELLVTERNYIRKLKVIIEVFQKCLESLQSENFLTDVDNSRLFSNINEVYETNSTFWDDYISQVIEEARKSKEPIKPRQLLKSFAMFEELFEPYMKYCLEEGGCVKYLKHLKRTNEMFEEYLAWCENHRQCMRLKLADLLVKPMQRVTKYGLLLKAILGKTHEDEDRISLETMITQVERFVTKINTTLRKRHEQQKLENIISKFEVYLPVEAVNEEVERIILDYSSLELRGKIPGLPQDEQRCILLDGPMRLIEKQGRVEVHAFLFTDVFVIAKPKKSGDKFRITRQPYRLNKIVLHPLKDPGSFLFVYLNEYNVLVSAFTLLVSAHEHMKWKENIDKAKIRYESARAATGSTLDFFDDDVPSFLNTPSNFTPNLSPAMDRRSMTLNTMERLNSSTESQPSIVVTDDMNIRNRSTIPRVSSQKQINTPEAIVKRSLSDPKNTWSRDPIARPKPRPVSLIATSDHDTASWVLKNEKRERSGSIPSDISNDSRRSSGIGDSFRSINSDGASAPSKDIPVFGSFSESSNVAQLKARFETRCQSPSTEEGSNSSISSTSLPTVSSDTVIQSNNRRATPPEYDQPSTIHEEEEQSSNHSYDKISELSTPRPEKQQSSETSNDSLKTLNESEFIVPTNVIPNRSNRADYENIENFKFPETTSNINSSSTQTDYFVPFVDNDITISSEMKEFSEIGIQCNNESNFFYKPNKELESHLLHRSDAVCYDLDDTVVIGDQDININKNENTSLPESQPCVVNTTEMTDVGTQSENYILTDISTQCDVTNINPNIDASTQCGDFIQLTGQADIEPTNLERSSSFPSKSSSMSSSTPMLDMLTNNSLPRQKVHSNNHHKPRGILKHSHSEVNLPLLKNIDTIYHERSRSDEPRHQTSLPSSPKSKQRNSAAIESFDSPGMRALQTLSESLESSLQHRTASVGSKPGNRSPSLRRLVLSPTGSNGSPLPQRKTAPTSPTSLTVNTNTELSDNEDDRRVLVRAQSESNFPSCSDSKRYTWHNFDSVEALERIQKTKHSVEGSPSTQADPPRKFDKAMSKSTNQINMPTSPRKQRSFKKALLKKFTDARNSDKNPKFDRTMSANDSKTSQSPQSSPDCIKQEKKLKEKERKKIKKEQKIREKEEKKREKESKRLRSNSFSSHSLPSAPKDKKWMSTSNVIQEVPS